MNFQDLRTKILKYPIFTDDDVLKWFTEEKLPSLQVQLSRWVEKKMLIRLRKGVYLLAEGEIRDRFVIAPLLYKPSYISLETALNSFGIIPDIPEAITCVAINKTSQFKTKFGFFIYRQIKKELFFGYDKVSRTPFSYFIARPEKAVLDYLYLKSRGIYPKSLWEIRFAIDKNFNWKRFSDYAGYFKNSKKLIKKFIEIYKK